MQITREYLTEMRERALQQQRSLVAQAQQAVGAVAMLDAMIARLDEPQPAPQED